MSAHHVTVPTISVARGSLVTHIVGMPADRTDRTDGGTDSGSLRERFRAAGLGAFFRPTDVAVAGMTRHQLPALVRSGQVERIGRGLYRLADVEPTEDYSLAMVCARVPNSVVCLLSALRVHGIGTQTSAAVWLAIPHKARAPRLREPRLRVVRFRGPAWTLGVEEVEFEGVRARITSPARTVVDCFRFERLVGPEAAMEALQDGLRRRKFTIAELSRVNDVLPARRLSAALDLRAI